MAFLAGTIIRSFLGDRDVVDMTFSHARARDAYKFRLAAHFLDRGAARVAHGRANAANQLMDDGNQAVSLTQCLTCWQEDLQNMQDQIKRHLDPLTLTD